MDIEIRNDIRSKLYEYVKTIGLNIEVIRYNKQSGIIKAVFTIPPSEQQITQIRSHIPILEKQVSLEGVETYDDILTTLTPATLDNYIDTHVTDLTSAKTYLKRLSKAVLFLYKKLEE